MVRSKPGRVQKRPSPGISGRFTGKDAATLEARGIASAQIADAIAALEHATVSASTVHSARKSITKSRATLRLLRDGLPDATYRRENRALRDAARALSAHRDSHVRILALDQLILMDKGGARASAPQHLRRALIRERDEISHSAQTGRTIEELRRSLRAAHERSVHWPAGRHGWSVIGKGLKRVYARGRRSLGQVRDRPSAECLHEFRKQVKYLWYQLQLMEPLSPGRIGKLADRLHKLSEYLGDYHDLATLRARIVAYESTFGDARKQETLLQLVDRRRETLQDKALLLGLHIYRTKPKRFASRLGRHWRKSRPAR